MLSASSDMAALNHRISLQRRAEGADALGQPVTTWSELAQVWADIRHMTGLQAIKADAQLSTVRASVRVRTRNDLAAGLRVVHGATVYEVRAVLKVNADLMDLVCEVVS